MLYDIGLGAAVKELLEETQAKYGIEYRFSDDGEIKSLRDDTRSFLFQCVQELLRNVVKHAQAEHISVRLSAQDNVAYIRVEDDGFGFDTRVLNNAHKLVGIGLSSIRERLRYVGGEIEVSSELCTGTLVTISCPVKKDP